MQIKKTRRIDTMTYNKNIGYETIFTLVNWLKLGDNKKTRGL